MNVTEKQIQDLRTRFFATLEKLESDAFHPADINRVKADDSYLRRFLLHNDSNEENAFNMLIETCEWRKKFKTNDITEKDVNQNILESGSIFSHGKDKDGKTLLVFKSKKHIKGLYDFDDHKKCLVYWMERLERQENGEMISLFFDMEGAVLSNMDLDYTKYLITLFKNYYPHFLNYIIIFEMAWVLNAVFRVIKTWLPPKAVEKMKSTSKSNVKEYIDPEYALKSWGGKVDFVYQFKPEQRSTFLTNSSGGDDSKKKVHFADGLFKQDQLNESGFEDSPTPISTSSTGLNISPSDVMMFSFEGNEATSCILLKNDDFKCIYYKIKTTSPEKFRVRPSSGVLNPGASAKISVVLVPDYHLETLQRDKFLIMSLASERSDLTQAEVYELLKFQQVSAKEVQQHRLRCAVPQIASNDFGVNNNTTKSADDQKKVSKLYSDVTKFNSHVEDLKKEMKLIKQQQRLIFFGLIVLLCSLAFIIYKDHVGFHPPRQECWSERRD